MKKLLLFALTFALATSAASAQPCFGNRCPPPQPSPATQYVPPYQWRPVPGTRQFGLFERGVQIGGVDPEQGYRSYSPEARTWGSRTEPPVPSPVRFPLAPFPGADPSIASPASTPAEKPIGALPDFAIGGVEQDHLVQPGERRVWYGDKPYTPIEGDGSTAATDVPDLSKQRFVSIIVEDPGLRKQISAAVEASTIRQRCQVNIMDPGDRRVAKHKLDQDKRFLASRFVCLIQDPPGPDRRGEALRAIYTFAGAAELFAEIEGVIGVPADPHYDPDAVPGPGGADLDDGTLLFVLFVAAGCGIYFFMGRKGQK